MTPIRFKNYHCKLVRAKYENGRTALILCGADGHEKITVATVNLPDEPLAPDEVFIKDYSENEGMLVALEAAGVVKATGRKVRSGYVEIPSATLTLTTEEGST